MNTSKQIQLTCFISFLILFNIILIMNFNLDYVSAQSSDKFLTIEKEFQLTEFSEHVGENINVDTINITMPSSQWNITSLKANFTDIKLGKEVFTVEEGGSSFNTIDKSTDGYGVQLNITEDILLFGVYIYGYLITSEIYSDVWVQIKGYDIGTDTPNSTQYGDSVLVNISSVPDWYLQEFPNPISLSKGQYYLVLNGTGFKNYDGSKYNWYLNEDDSIHTNLYTTMLNFGIWTFEDKGSPFRHKLIQRTDKSYDPEEINMTIGINGDIFSITNGIEQGTGTLNVEDINHFPNATSLISQIYINTSVGLLFNMTYKASYVTFLEASGTLRIEENKDNLWSVSPIITRKFENHTIYFNYHDNWNGIKVMRNSQDITSQVVINETLKTLFLPNETILDDATWLIQVNSTNTNFNLDLPRLEFRAGQELKFSLEEPALNGNYTFILYDSLGYELGDSLQIKQIPGDTLIFSYNLSSISNEGAYKAYIYWNDLHDAGIVTQEFNIIIPEVFDPAFMIGIIIISIVSILAGITIYITVKKSNEKSKVRKEAIFKKWKDITNLQYFMLIEKKGSLNVFEQVFTNRSIDPTLITGFLSAIRSFGIELTNSEDKTQTIKLEYKDSKILMAEFKHFRLIFIMGDVPSQYFLQSIADLSTDIEENFGKMLQNFVGNTKPFEGVEDLLKKHMKTSVLYPLKISVKKGIKITPIEKTVLLKASNILRKQKKDYFYTTFLLHEREIDAKEIEAIVNLIDKGIFIPLL
ncbi:MAG: hypothetical protein ACTSP9_17810 [Promethearchaeota archaeon]